MSSQTFQDEGSFVILGTSPQQSLSSIRQEHVVNGNGGPMMSDLLDELMDIKLDTPQSTLPFKAHFDLSKTPSPNSLMMASNLVSKNQPIDQLQTKFAKILDENQIFKETLRQNHLSMKDQLELISSYQEDMLQTHQMHKDKFEQTKTLMHKLRAENSVLKDELGRLKELQITKSSSLIEEAVQNGVNEKKDEVTASVYEFVASPDEDTINKLTSQIELVEKQRRQLITDNEKLLWQKESLEHLIDATSNERDDLKQKVKDLELAYSKQQVNHDTTMKQMTFKMANLESQLQELKAIESVEPERLLKQEQKVKSLEEKLANLHSQLKSAQLKIRELENVRLEHSRQKHDSFEVVRQYKEQLLEVQGRLREAQTVVFQPVRSSLNIELCTGSDYADFANNVRLYDKTLKHIAEFLNFYSARGCDFLNSTLQIVGHIQEIKSDPNVKDEVLPKMSQLKTAIEEQQASSLEQKIQIKATLSIFEKIFKDYQAVLKSLQQSKLEAGQGPAPGSATQQAALEEERDIARAQADVYRIDFEAERESRQKLVSEKEQMATDLRQMQRRNQDLTLQLEEVRRLNPNIHRSATQDKSQESIGQVPLKKVTPGNIKINGKKAAGGAGNVGGVGSAMRVSGVARVSPPPIQYTCPVCDTHFRSLRLLEEHVDRCIDKK